MAAKAAGSRRKQAEGKRSQHKRRAACGRNLGGAWVERAVGVDESVEAKRPVAELP
jgi:hypothetical protein